MLRPAALAWRYSEPSRSRARLGVAETSLLLRHCVTLLGVRDVKSPHKCGASLLSSLLAGTLLHDDARLSFWTDQQVLRFQQEGCRLSLKSFSCRHVLSTTEHCVQQSLPKAVSVKCVKLGHGHVFAIREAIPACGIETTCAIPSSIPSFHRPCQPCVNLRLTKRTCDTVPVSMKLLPQPEGQRRAQEVGRLACIERTGKARLMEAEVWGNQRI